MSNSDLQEIQFWGKTYGSLTSISPSMTSETESISDSVPIVPVVNSVNSLNYSMDMDISLCSSQEISDDTRLARAHLQAVVFIEDAIEHRSIHHKVDKISLYRYRLYHSKYIQWLFRFTITILLILPFFEPPSSLTWSSDPRKRGDRYKFPCGITESIELLCFIVMSVDLICKVVILGKRHAKHNYWLLAYGFVLLFSYIDWFISLGHICNEKWRIRRLLRPFFLIQNSSLMKKTVNSIQRSIPQILSVLFLLALHLYFFTMFGMVLFAPEDFNKQSVIISVNDTSSKGSLDMLNNKNEGKAYFYDLGAAIMSLIILLTTANNPDVMMPAYSDNRFYAIFFILFLGIGMYFFMNVLLAVIYNQFKGSFTQTMQSSFIRRRCGIRAAFEVLLGVSYHDSPSEPASSCVEVSLVQDVLKDIRFSKKSRYMPMLQEFLVKINTNFINANQFQELFDIVFKDSIKKRHPCREFQHPVLLQVQSVLLHNYFQYFGDFMCVLNVLVVTVELATTIDATFSGDKLSVLNFCFISYFAIEQVLMIYFIGAKRYFSHKNVWFESIVTWALVLVEIIFIALYGGPFPLLTKEEIIARSQNLMALSVYNLLRITNMLIIIRILRIIPSIKPLSVVARAMVDLAKNLKSFGGIVIVIYYVFALIGMMIFQEQSPKPTLVNGTLNTYRITNPNITCGYEQLDYYANNFDDFAASLVVLWDVMVVNNWYIFLNAYSTSMNNRYTQLYFVSWWLTSVVICINLFVALVIEAFITQWEHQLIIDEKKHKKRKYAQNEETSRHFRVHEWFRATYKEPTEKEILKEIYSHQYLRRYTLLKPKDLQDE